MKSARELECVFTVYEVVMIKTKAKKLINAFGTNKLRRLFDLSIRT